MTLRLTASYKRQELRVLLSGARWLGFSGSPDVPRKRTAFPVRTVLYDACVLYPAPLRDLLMWLSITDL